MKIQEKSRSSDAEQLNALLALELSATAAYQSCLERVEEREVASELQVLRVSHKHRAELLAMRVEGLGEVPRMRWTRWGGVQSSESVSSSSSLLKAVCSTLADGEAQGLSAYEEGLERLSIVERKFVRDILLPEQQRSAGKLRNLQCNLPLDS